MTKKMSEKPINIYKPTKELESMPMMVARLLKVNQALREEIAELKKQLAQNKDG